MATILQKFSNTFSLVKINFDQNFTKVCSLVSNQQYSSIGSDNGLVPPRRQAIIWTKDGEIIDAYMSGLTLVS